MNLQELIDQRANTVHLAREILNKAEAEKRELTTEEDTNYKKAISDSTGLKVKIDREIQLQEEERTALATVAPKVTPAGATAIPKETKDERAMKGLRSWLRHGISASADGMAEFRALQADVDTTGGFLVMPESFVSGLLKGIDDMVFMRQKATVYPLPDAQSLGAVSLDADPADADWTTELAIGGEDSTMAFGKRKLTPNPLGKLIKASETLLRKTQAEALIQQRLAYKFGITQEKAFLTGTGAGQPLGVFTASTDGVTTARDVSTGNTTTAITIDGLINAKYSLKGQYHSRADWMFHRDAISALAKLKDGNGQYIWKESPRVGEPDMLLGRPFQMSEYVPNTFTTGLYVGILGDFSYYWIADSLAMRVQRLVELYAATNQIGFIGRLETDGMPVLAEAFARVKLA